MTEQEQKHFNEVRNSIGLMKNEDARANYGNHATAIKVLEAHLAAITAANTVSHPKPETAPVTESGAITSESAANAVSEHFPDATKMVQPQSKQCGLCGDADKEAQASCTVPACFARESQEAIAWEATTPGYIKYVTDKQYRSYSETAKRWYKPYKCSSCQAQATEPAPKQAELRSECSWCETCQPLTLGNMRMIVCPECGNKRCPKATHHNNPCTNSNDIGQKGSSWEHVKPASPEAKQ